MVDEISREARRMTRPLTRSRAAGLPLSTHICREHSPGNQMNCANLQNRELLLRRVGGLARPGKSIDGAGNFVTQEKASWLENCVEQR